MSRERRPTRVPPRSQQRVWEAACTGYVAAGTLPLVYFVVSFDDYGQQYSPKGPYVDHRRAVELARAESAASGDDRKTYVISLFVDGITQVVPE